VLIYRNAPPGLSVHYPVGDPRGIALAENLQKSLGAQYTEVRRDEINPITPLMGPFLMLQVSIGRKP